MGTDTICGGRLMLPGHPDMGTGTISWGQARCRVYRSGTFNVQRSTLNFQWGDRKGPWWAGYGDRHDVGPASLAAAPGYGDRHDVRYIDRERLTSNVQLSTFNWVTERADGGRKMGTDTVLDRRVWLRRADMGTGTMSGIPDMVTDTMPGIPIGKV